MPTLTELEVDGALKLRGWVRVDRQHRQHSRRDTYARELGRIEIWFDVETWAYETHISAVVVIDDGFTVQAFRGPHKGRQLLAWLEGIEPLTIAPQ